MTMSDYRNSPRPDECDTLDENSAWYKTHDEACEQRHRRGIPCRHGSLNNSPITYDLH